LVTELGDLSLQLGLPVSDKIQEMVEKARPEPTHTEVRIEGQPRCYELENAEVYPCALPPDNAYHGLPDSGESERSQSWETKQGFADQINDYLTVFRYAAHYLGYLLPSNRARTPSEDEKRVLESTLAQIRTYNRPIQRLLKSPLNDPQLFDDRISAIINNSRHMTEAVNEILTSNSVTTHLLAEIQDRLTKTQTMLVELTDLNKQLNQMRGKVGAHERVVVGRDGVTNKLTASREAIPEPVVYIAPAVAPTAVYTPMWNVPQNRPTVIAGNVSNLALRS